MVQEGRFTGRTFRYTLPRAASVLQKRVEAIIDEATDFLGELSYCCAANSSHSSWPPGIEAAVPA